MNPVLIRRVALGLAACALLVLGGRWAAQRFYLEPAETRRGQAAALRQNIERLEGQLRPQFEVNARLKELARNGLAPQPDLADHQLRTLLSRIGQAAGLEEIKASTGPVREQVNPAVRFFSASQQTRLRQRPDFLVLPGRLEGVGDPERVLAALASISVQPWAHRVSGVSLRPAGRDTRRLSLKVDVESMIAPDLAPRSAPEPQIVPTPADAEAALRAVASRDLFSDPPPPVAATPADAPRPAPAREPQPAPAGPAYEQWRLTGLAVVGGSAEAIFTHTPSSAGSTIRQGERILDLLLVGAGPEAAVLEIDGRKFEVRLGATLASRTPLGG